MKREIVTSGIKGIKDSIEAEVHYLIIRYMLLTIKNLTNEEILELAPYFYLHKYYIDCMKKYGKQSKVTLETMEISLATWKLFVKAQGNDPVLAFESLEYLVRNDEQVMTRFNAGKHLYRSNLPEEFKDELIGEICAVKDRPMQMLALATLYESSCGLKQSNESKAQSTEYP